MRQFMARCLARVRALLIPQTMGRHRAAATPAPPPCTCPGRVVVRTVLVWPGNPPRLPLRARRHRPVERPVDGDRSPLVRPYYTAHEEEALRRDAELFGYEITCEVTS